ncbi:hypothetical protein J508_2475 [Acinetobacter sp. 1289694]|nr:hypothetical protein J508_2475 [Acinetobacter sp. 1289694]
MCINKDLSSFDAFIAKDELETFGSSCGKSTNSAVVVSSVL